MPAKTFQAEPIRPLNLRVEEAAIVLGLGRTQTYKLIKDGRLRAFKRGRLTRVTREEAERLAREIADSSPQRST